MPPIMTQSFFFGFESDDIEEGADGDGDGNENGNGNGNDDHPESKPVAVMEPRLHKLQDLV